MQLSLISLALVGIAVVAYLLVLRRGIYRRIPYEQYLLMGVATLLAFYAVWQDRSILTLVALAVSALVLGVLIWFIHFESKFPRARLKIKIGERFPSFSLPDSQGGVYESDRKRGEKSALYLFYRGDW
jgi:predicted membrane channel-forming protein YqfA (hemolysin III family)